MPDISLEKLIEVGAHYGHQTKRWNPKMEEYLHGEKGGIHIFDLIKSKKLMEEAFEFLSRSKSEGKTILLLGTKKQVREKVKEIALNTSCFYVTERWLGGTITNFEQIKRSTMKLSDMKKKMSEGSYKDRTKKERLLIEREIERLERFFGGLTGIDKIPDVLFIVDIRKEKTALHEALEKNVSVVAIVDSNSDPTEVNYPIPMNDDATKALEYVMGLLEQALLEGRSGKSSTQGQAKSKTSVKKKVEAKVKTKAKK